MRKIKIFFILLSVFFTFAATTPSSPIPMLQQTADQMIQSLKEHKGDFQNEPTAVYNIVRENLLPHVDVIGMSRSAVGPHVWREATQSERERFEIEFTNLVIRTYSGALANYTNEQVIFMPIRGSLDGQRFVTVDSIVERSNADNIPLSYSLVLKGDGWKVYDMNVGGVSLLQSYRSQFSSELSKMSFDGLITKLAKSNGTD